MRLFKDGRGLLRRVRWVRVIAVTAAIGAGVAWARRGDEAAVGALKTITTSACVRCDGELDYGELEDLSDAVLIDAVLGPATKSGYVGPVQPGSACKECELGSSQAALIDAVGIGGIKQGYVFESSCQVPAAAVPIGK